MIPSSTISIVNTGNINSITPQQIVSLAKDELGLETTDKNMSLERLVFMGLGALDCPSLKVKRFETVQVCNDSGLYTAPIPCGLYYPLMIVPHCGGYMSQYIYADILELNRCGCNTSTYGNFMPYQSTYQFEENNIVLHNPNVWTGINNENQSQTFTYPRELDIYFMGANVGADGFVRIYQQYEAALVAYVCWKYARRSKGKYAKDDKESWYAEFKRERATLISSERKAESDLEKVAVRSLLKALVVNPCIGYGQQWLGGNQGFIR